MFNLLLRLLRFLHFRVISVPVFLTTLRISLINTSFTIVPFFALLCIFSTLAANTALLVAPLTLIAPIIEELVFFF